VGSGECLFGGDGLGGDRVAYSGLSEYGIGDDRGAVFGGGESCHVNQVAGGERCVLGCLDANSARRVLNAERRTGPIQGDFSAQMDAVMGVGQLVPMQQTVDRHGRALEGIAGRCFHHGDRGQVGRHEVDADHLAVAIDGGSGIGVDSDFGVDQGGVGLAGLAQQGYADGSAFHGQAKGDAMAVLKDGVDSALDLNPLGVVKAGFEPG